MIHTNILAIYMVEEKAKAKFVQLKYKFYSAQTMPGLTNIRELDYS
jgi:hypothetical protein